MARPTSPLISRKAAVRAALELIDENGIENFTLRKLGAKLGVHGMSIYHHFRDKEEILDEVAAFVLADVRVAKAPSDDVLEWTVANAKRYRKALLRHPNAMPLFVKRLPVRTRAAMYIHEFEALERMGIASQYRIMVLETIESFVLGGAIFLRDAPDRNYMQLTSDNKICVARVAPADRPISYDEAFESAFREFIAALYNLYRHR